MCHKGVENRFKVSGYIEFLLFLGLIILYAGMIIHIDDIERNEWRFHAFFGTQLGYTLIFIIVRGIFERKFVNLTGLQIIKLMVLFDVIRSIAGVINLIVSTT